MAILAAKEELRVRLKAERPGQLDEQRARLRTQLDKLANLYRWDHITESDYRKQRSVVENSLAALPTNDRLVQFDRHHLIATSLPDAIAAATPEQLQELIATLVERVDTANKVVTSITWVPAARPFFREPAVAEQAEPASFWRLRTDSGAQYPRSVLDYYLEVG